MVEGGSYQQFSWGQLAFTKLMKSLRKEYKPDKQMYRLNEFPYALNIWVYECASVIHNKIAVKEGNGIPRICNWKVVAPKPKFEMFMEIIFTEVDEKIGALEALIKKNHSELVKAVGAKDNKSDKDNDGNYMPYIVDDSVEKDNVEPQPTSDQFFQQTISPIQMDFATVDHDIDSYTVEVEINMLLKKMLQRYVSDT
ncbi:hypothetical protein KY284_036384 [Solanum tuberosum]|nr:hypothetical protein KY284_036384 [Solanum tuberosum]